MRFNVLYNKLIGENNLAGSGSVFGPGSVNVSGKLQGDNLYNPESSIIAKGNMKLMRRLPARKKRKKINEFTR